MGGEINSGQPYFALWLDDQLAGGHSMFMSTFRNARLSAEERFTVDALEVWSLVDPPSPEEVPENLAGI